MTLVTKSCTRCKQGRDISQFAIVDGVQISSCQKCTESSARYRKKHASKIAASKKAYVQRKFEESGAVRKYVCGPFWSKVEKIDGGCWNWVAGKNTYGYGQTTFGGKKALAHRRAYMELVGPIPRGLTLDHLCRNRGCVNPEHLEPVTQKENTLRGMSVAALNAAKTQCPSGHPYEGENVKVYRNKNGQAARYCVECSRIKARAYEKRVRERDRASRKAA